MRDVANGKLLTGIPEDVQVVLLVELIQALVQAEDDLLLGEKKSGSANCSSMLQVDRRTSFVPPWKGTLSPLSLKPNPRIMVTGIPFLSFPPREQASMTPRTIGAALRVGVWLVKQVRVSFLLELISQNVLTYMKTSFSAWRRAASQAAA